MIPWADGRSQFVLPIGCRPHNIRIVMPAADANDMYQRENVHSNHYRPCTIIVNDQTAHYMAGARLKSSEHGRFQDNRVGFNLKFGSDDLFFGAHQRLAVGDGDLVVVGVDFAEGEEAVAIAAIFDERRLQRRFDTGYLGQIDIALELLVLGGLEIKLLDAVSLGDRDPGFFPVPRVDQHARGH